MDYKEYMYSIVLSTELVDIWAQDKLDEKVENFSLSTPRKSNQVRFSVFSAM